MSTAPEFHAAAFQFVKGLAQDLSRDDLELPGFPDSVVRLHRDLADEKKSVQDIVQLINTEPALAARLIRLANSAAFNSAGRKISDPRAAVTQLGFNIVRSTATAFAMRQMEQQDWLIPVRPELEKIWRRSNGVAAICHVVGGEVSGVKADEAMAAGLLHLIGKLYLLTQAHREGLAVAENPEWDDIARDWHPTIARAFIEAWGMPKYVADAVEYQDAVARGEHAEHSSQLTRLLSAAKLYDNLQGAGERAARPFEERLERVQLHGGSFLAYAREQKERIGEVAREIS